MKHAQETILFISINKDVFDHYTTDLGDECSLVPRGMLDLPPLRGYSPRQTSGRPRPDRGKYATILNL